MRDMACWVDEHQRGQGIGNALMAGLVDGAKATGVIAIAATVKASNTAALALATRHGFVQRSRRNNAYTLILQLSHSPSERVAMMNQDEIHRRVVAAVGEAGARELLDVLTQPDADRAAMIGRLSLHGDGEWLAELLIDLEEDEPARLRLVAALRHQASSD